jgi:hypothetical protein
MLVYVTDSAIAHGFDMYRVSTVTDSDITLTSGETLALSEVFFNVSPTPATGSFTVSFTGTADTPNGPSDASGDNINIDVSVCDRLHALVYS